MRAAVSWPGAPLAALSSSSCAAHGDLRHCGLEIEPRLRRRSLAGLSHAAQAAIDRFQPSDSIDQRLPIAVPRGIRTLEDLGDRFERARGPRFGA